MRFFTRHNGIHLNRY